MQDKNAINRKGRKYEIKKTKESILSKGEICAGFCDTLNKEICIKIGDNTEDVCQTIVHELIHANLFECGLIEDSGKEDLTEWLEVQFLIIIKQFLKIIGMLYPSKKYDARTIDNLITKLFEVNKCAIHI